MIKEHTEWSGGDFHENFEQQCQYYDGELNKIDFIGHGGAQLNISIFLKIMPNVYQERNSM